MSELAIRAEGLSKRYRIGASSGPYKTLRESLMAVPTRPLRAARSRLRRSSEEDTRRDEIWALRDVSFDVEAGEVLGIIGRNGAGKSTLLKVLSRITEPTLGAADIHGRVGSLLEVGTGFHPELTGRENIFLNGAILGMKRAEIKARFDEIAAFAEIEQFLDTPVKRYSSGMYMRLAFSVAAHLDPEILIVDEVLAVGDASFQKKCLNKMEDVGRQGRTVIFVSHNMSAVTRLCDRAILLLDGKPVADGPTPRVVSSYLESNVGGSAVREWTAERRPGNEVARLEAVRVRNDNGESTDTHDIRCPITLEMDFEVLAEGYKLVPAFHVHNQEGVCVFVLHDVDPEWRGRSRPAGHFRSSVTIPGNFMAEGAFSVRVFVATHDPDLVHVDEPDAVAFHVADSLDGNTARGDFAGTMPGIVRPLLPWRNEILT
jgi:lipopolysaccharide transport system ATP-binding protein